MFNRIISIKIRIIFTAFLLSVLAALASAIVWKRLVQQQAACYYLKSGCWGVDWVIPLSSVLRYLFILLAVVLMILIFYRILGLITKHNTGR